MHLLTRWTVAFLILGSQAFTTLPSNSSSCCAHWPELWRSTRTTRPLARTSGITSMSRTVAITTSQKSHTPAPPQNPTYKGEYPYTYRYLDLADLRRAMAADNGEHD